MLTLKELEERKERKRVKSRQYYQAKKESIKSKNLKKYHTEHPKNKRIKRRISYEVNYDEDEVYRVIKYYEEGEEKIDKEQIIDYLQLDRKYIDNLKTTLCIMEMNDYIHNFLDEYKPALDDTTLKYMFNVIFHRMLKRLKIKHPNQ